MSRTYRDPIHNEIKLDSTDSVEKLLIRLIDTKELQRLRWIRQLGTSWYTFHGAEASRFQHSLGAMHIARLMFNHLIKKAEDRLELDQHQKEKYKALVLSAALLHDIGHGPFSHSSESIVETKHEVWTAKLISSPESEVNKVLNQYDPGLAEELVQILNKTHPVKFLSSIVSSQLDCDRFDYLLRDSYYTGTSYGNFDLNRVISSLDINTKHDCLVVSGEKGMLAVEDYLYARYSMYLQVYQHKKCLATDKLLQKLFQRARVLIRSKRIAYIENELYNWVMEPDKLTIDDFLTVDDGYIMHHIKHWVNERDYILKDLADRFINRRIFKAFKVDKNSEGENLSFADLKARLFDNKKELLKSKNLDPDYYLDTVSIAKNPYSFYNPDTSDFFKAIFVETSSRLIEISELSHIVSSLVTDDYENQWIISVAESEEEGELEQAAYLNPAEQDENGIPAPFEQQSLSL